MAYSSLFGNPADPATRIGDLAFHRGKILLVKFHISNKLPPPFETIPDSEITEFEFNGLATIVEDFAAAGIEVTEGANNRYTFRMSAAQGATYSEFLLIPFGTNLFRAAEDYRTAYSLTTAAGPTLEGRFFESQAESRLTNEFGQQDTFRPSPGNTAPQMLVKRSLSTSPNPKQYLDGTITRTVQGGPNMALVTRFPNASALTTWHALHRHTVAELLTLKPFYDSNVELNSSAAEFVNARLVLTPFGWQLLFTERFTSAVLSAPFAAGNDARDNSTHQYESLLYAQGRGWRVSAAFFYRNRAIKFRVHGWPYMEQGLTPFPPDPSARINTMFFSPKHGMLMLPNGGPARGSPAFYSGELKAKDGADYSAREPASIVESDIKILRKISAAHIPVATPGSPFRPPWFRDAFNWIWSKKGNTTEFKWSLWQNKSALQSHLGLPANQPETTYSLLADHYNALAMAVNQCTLGRALDYRALRFHVTLDTGQPPPNHRKTYSTGIVRNLVYSGEPAGATPSLPIPVDAFDFTCAFQPGQAGPAMMQLYAQNGVPVRNLNDFEIPGAAGVPSWSAALATRNIDRLITINGSVNVSGVYPAPPPPAPPTAWRGHADGQFTYDITYQNSAHPPGTAFFPFPIVPGGFAGFSRLADLYAGFQWVKQSDVLAWLSGFGLPVLPAGFDELFIPLALRVLKSGRQAAEGQWHQPAAAVPDCHITVVAGLTNEIPGQYGMAAHDAARTTTHTNVDCLAFVPEFDPAKIKWKQQPFTRTTRNIKFWDSKPPVFFHQQIIGQLHAQGRQFILQNPAADQPFPRPEFAPFFDADKPVIHLEFTAAPGDTQAQADHDLWAKLNVGTILPLAIRAGSGNPNNAPPFMHVFRPFWRPRGDALFGDSRLVAAVPDVWNGGLISRTGPTGGTCPPRPAPPQGVLHYEPEWVKQAAPAIPALAQGINLLTPNPGDGNARHHIQFANASLTLIPL